MVIPLNALGLVLDIFGVFFIGWSFFYSINWRFLTGREYPVKTKGMRSLEIKNIYSIPSSFDGIIGTVLLVVGFVLQIAGIFIKTNFSFSVLFIVVSFLLVFTVSYFWYFREEIVEWWLGRVSRKDREDRMDSWAETKKQMGD